MLLKYILLYILLCLIWGTTWLAIRLGLEDFAPFFSAGLRFVVAAVVLGAIIYLKKIPLPFDKKSMLIYIMLGMFSFFVPFGMVYWGEQHVSSGLAAVLFAVYPFGVTVFSHFILRNEEITPRKVAGMVLSFAGVYTIFHNSIGGGSDLYVIGMFMILISAVMQAYILVLFKKHGSYLNALSVNFIPVLIAGVSFFISSAIIEPEPVKQITAAGISTTLYLGIFGTVITFTTYYYLLKRIPLLLLSFIAFITPVIAVIADWLFAAEKLSEKDLIGSALVVAGLGIANLVFNKKNQT
ncbi:MAG: S-adenosylmethionine/S-adenosylhomocysteine transporter [Ignavibacteriaceae bacterium]|nr:S-adenosylmethionine/S-adenosylhomocysteine transporter [Ignavibacteriaceae bacterium]